jgi:C4-dicarboxylate-binding protein DctP
MREDETMMKRIGIAALCGAAAIFSVSLMLFASDNSSAQTAAKSSGKVITLRIGGPHTPAAAPWVKLLQDVFIHDVKTRAAAGPGYRVEFTEAWGGSVAKMNEVLASVQGGILDIGYVTVPSEVSKLPLHNFNYWLPFGPSSPMQAYRATKAVYDQFPVLKGTFETKYGQKFLGFSTIEGYGLVATFPVTSLNDLKGRKVGGVGPNLDYVRFAGGVPVTAGIPDMYLNIQTHVMDGMIIIPSAIVGGKMWEIAKYWTATGFGSICPHVLTINLDSWKALPADLQPIIVEAGNAWTEALAKHAQESEKRDLESWQEHGGKVVTLPSALREQWAALFPTDYVAERAKPVDAMGLPGTEVVGAYLKDLTAEGYKPPRKWELGVK